MPKHNTFTSLQQTVKLCISKSPNKAPTLQFSCSPVLLPLLLIMGFRNFVLISSPSGINALQEGLCPWPRGFPSNFFKGVSAVPGALLPLWAWPYSCQGIFVINQFREEKHIKTSTAKRVAGGGEGQIFSVQLGKRGWGGFCLKWHAVLLSHPAF